jgi:diadenosine tetraphosphatase ApaH/serine/threonine PP2A family protein phosphatase
MLYGICSDIHSNATAFKAVLESMRDNGVERKVCLGDIVGYGVDTDECVDLVRENMDFCLIGNHDSVAVKNESSEGFNPYAKQAIEWTQKHLSKDSVAYIRSLPYIHEENDICFVHASPLSPADWVYVTDLEDALNAFDHFSERYCFVGHTHSPVIIASRPMAIPKILDEYEYVIANTERLLVNVGSVGQPRDRDPRACWCLLDTETKCVRLIRVEYDIRKTQNRMKKQGMPSFLIDRLSVGR